MMKLMLAALVGVFALGGTLSGQAPSPQPAQTAPTQEQRDRLERIRQLLQARQLLPSPESNEAAERRREEQRVRLTALAGLDTCALPDGTTHPVNKTVTVLGWKYRCIEVRDASLVRSGVGWTRLPESEQDPLTR
jgi:hypothetical protein